MNIKPSFQAVVSAIGKSQDGGQLNPNDDYGKLLLLLVTANTETSSSAIDAGEVDTEELASNLRYAIHEFQKALEAVESFNK